MQRSVKSRLEALERLEAEHEPPAFLPPVPPPTFDAVLAGFDLVMAALGDGRALVRPAMYCWDHGVETRRYSLCGMGDPAVLRWGLEVARLVREDGLTFTTTEEYIAWIHEHRRPAAFVQSRTDAELDLFVTMDAIDPLFYTPAQRALADEWARLVEQEGCDDVQGY